MPLLPADARERTLCLATLSNTFGNGLWVTGSALFLTLRAGIPAAQVGLALSIGGFVGVAAGVPVGRLADVRDVARLRAGSQAAQAVSVILLLCVHSFATLVPLVCVEALASTSNQVARGALVAAVAGRDGRVRLWATMRATSNVGHALGSAAGGAVIAVGSRQAFVAVPVLDFLSFAGSVGFLVRLGHVRAELAPDPTAARAGGPLRDRRFLGVVAIGTLLLMGTELVTFPLPLWITGHTAAPGWLVAVVAIGVNAVGVAITGRVRRGDDSFAGSARHFLAGAALLALGIAGFGLAALGGETVAVVTIVAATGVFAVGEVVTAIRGSAMAFALSPDGQIGVYQGVVNTAQTLGLAIAPGVFGLALLGHGDTAVLGWVAVGATMLAGGAVAPRLAADAVPTPATVVAGREPAG